MKYSWRFYTEVVCAVLGTALLILTLINHEWIEEVFGVEPDGGNGIVEWGIVVVLLAVVVTSSVLAYRHHRRAVGVHA